jgi:hypothetical protein
MSGGVGGLRRAITVTRPDRQSETLSLAEEREGKAGRLTYKLAISPPSHDWNRRPKKLTANTAKIRRPLATCCQ